MIHGFKAVSENRNRDSLDEGSIGDRAEGISGDRACDVTMSMRLKWAGREPESKGHSTISTGSDSVVSFSAIRSVTVIRNVEDPSGIASKTMGR